MDKQTSKITFRAWKDAHAIFKHRIKEACLQRDPYLDIVLRHEAQTLEKEISKPNSEAAWKFLKHGLQRLDSTPVSLTLSQETVELINDTCERKRIPRDSFINRVILFLLMRRAQFGRLLFIDIEEIIKHRLLDEFGSELAFDYTSGGIAFVSIAVKEDPFWAIRQCINYANQDESGSGIPLHEAFIDQHFTDAIFPDKSLNLNGLNCYVADHQIEGTPEHDKMLSIFDDLLAPEETSQRKRKEA